MNLSYTSLQVGRSIVASSVTSLGMIVIDTAPTIYTYLISGVYEKHNILKGFKSYIHRYGHLSAVSDNADYALICDSEGERVLLFHLERMRLISQVKYSKNPDFCTFSHDATYFAIANSIGRFSFYETITSELQGEVHFSDGISAVVFSDNLKKIAIATLDKKVHIYDVEKKVLQSIFVMDDIVEALSLGNDLTTLVAYTRLGNTYILKPLLNQKYLADPCFEWPTFVAHQQDSHIVLLGTRSNELFIYTNSSGDKLGSLTLDYWGITSVSLHVDKIFVGFSDGHGVLIDLKPMITEALDALETKNYQKICVFMHENPIVFTSLVVCKKIEANYKEIFAYKAISFVEKSGLEAIVTFVIASNVNKQELLSALYVSPEILSFMESFNQGDISKACAIAYEKPLLKQLREYSEIRTNCYSQLQEEIRLLETNPLKFREYIDAMPVQCNECLQGILPNANKLEESYKQLLSSSSAQNFSAVMEITEKYPALRQSRVYRRLMNYGEAFIDKTLIMISAGKMFDAQKYASNLARIKPFASTGKDFQLQIEAYEQFNKACEFNDIPKVFSLIHEYPVLRTTEIFKAQVLYHQKNILVPALHYAKLGEVAKLHSVLKDYENIDYFEEKHFNVLKLALITEVEKYAPIGEEQALLDKYYHYFGWDEQYKSVCELLGCTQKEAVHLDEVTDAYKQLLTLLNGARYMRSKMILKENNHESN